MTKHCKACSAEIPDDARFCPQCGADIRQADVLSCPKCQTANPAGAKFCKKCGSGLSGKTKSPAAVSKSFARSHFWMLQGAGFLALIVVGIYYYYGFVKTLEGKADVHNRPPAREQTSQKQAEEEHNHPAPTEADIQAAVDQLKSDPENAVLNTNMGNVLFDSGRYADAIPYYQKVLKLNPNNADIIVDLGVCYFNLQEFPKAKEQFNLALKANPQHINALYNLGVVAMQSGEKDQVIEYWSRLMQIAPNSPQAARAMQILNEFHQNVSGSGGESGSN